jgi:hypothetical protein
MLCVFVTNVQRYRRELLLSSYLVRTVVSVKKAGFYSQSKRSFMTGMRPFVGDYSQCNNFYFNENLKTGEPNAGSPYPNSALAVSMSF